MAPNPGITTRLTDMSIGGVRIDRLTSGVVKLVTSGWYETTLDSITCDKQRQLNRSSCDGTERIPLAVQRFLQLADSFHGARLS